MDLAMRGQAMELRQLACFVVVAEELHFGRAAKRLGMTQPPLSRQIQLLEQQLGTLLLERNSRQVSLTTAGRSFLRDARYLLEYSQRAARNARRASSGGAGRITLGFTAVASYRLMPDLVVRSRQLLPDVEVLLREMVTPELARHLVAGELDAVLTRALPQQSGLNKYLMQREPLLVALADTHPMAVLNQIPLQGLHRQPFVLYSPTEGKYFHDRVVGALELADVQPAFVQSAGQTHTVLALVRAGLGMAIVPASARELRLEGVVFRPLADKDLHADIYLAWRSRHDNPALDAFLGRVAGIESAAID
ncbi:Transcriptional regulator, LysR family [plant metagenome]|uniref:Transcriptional regulator, LysR family n=2 Tax=plant metagenome TaxID=1297885 RepID=A0A484P3N0_9ZZZZ